MPFRIGGDEFAHDPAETDEAETVAPVVDADRRRISRGATRTRPTSCGPASGWRCSPRDGGDADSLFRAADDAMYAAKRQAPAATSPGRDSRLHADTADDPCQHGMTRASLPRASIGRRQPTALVRRRGLLEVTKLVRSDEDLSACLPPSPAHRGVARLRHGRGATCTGRRGTTSRSRRCTEATTSPGSADRDTRGWDVWAPLLTPAFQAPAAPTSSLTALTGSLRAERVPPADRGSARPTRGTPRTRCSSPSATRDGHLLGVLSVDEPASATLPTDDDLDVLVGHGRSRGAGAAERTGGADAGASPDRARAAAARCRRS